jgi:hypothetical protein
MRVERIQEQSKMYAQIIARAWQDDVFRQRLIASPTAVFEENGIRVSNGVTIRVMESTPDTYYVCLPLRPDELSDEMLDQVAGGQAPMYCTSSSYQGMWAQDVAPIH